MLLSESSTLTALDLVRDAEFHALGLLSASTPSTLACLYDRKFLFECSRNANLAAVLTSSDLADSIPEHLGVAVALDPRNAFFEIHRYLGTQTDFYGSDFPSEISPRALIDTRAHVASRRVRIGDGCRVEPGAVVLEGTTLEDEVVIRAGAVIGAEGFQPASFKGHLEILPHYGSVLLHRNVEVQSNSVICRDVFHGATEIGEDTKIGPLAYIAHAVRIGARCRIAASVRIAGSSSIGEEVFMGPNAVISNRIRVGNRARISLGSVVVSNVPPGQTVTGNFAVEHSRFMSFYQTLLK